MHLSRSTSATGTPGASAAQMSRVLQQHADLPRRHTRRSVVRASGGRTARLAFGTVLCVGVALIAGGAPTLIAGCVALAVALLWPIHWLATLPPRPGDPDPTAVHWSKGADGERRTARLLRPLERRGWAVLHDRRLPGSPANIDHLVIGPNGVQLIDSKVWRAPVRWSEGLLWCGMVPVDLRTTAWEAMRVEELLRPLLIASGCVRVEAVMCVHGPTIPRPGFTIRVSRAELGSARPGDVVVHVIAARDLRRHIQRCSGGMVAGEDVSGLAIAAAREFVAAA